MKYERLTQQQKDKIFELYLENYTYAEISDELEIESQTIYNYINYTVPPHLLQRQKPIPKPTPQTRRGYCPYCDKELTSENDKAKGYHYQQYDCICKHKNVKVISAHLVFQGFGKGIHKKEDTT